MTFGKWLEIQRVAQGLTIEKAASNMGISRQSYRQYEKAENMPKYATLQRLSDALGIPVETLTRYTPGMDITFGSTAYDAAMKLTEADIQMSKNRIDLQHFSERPKPYDADRLLAAFNLLNEDGKRLAIRQVEQLTSAFILIEKIKGSR